MSYQILVYTFNQNWHVNLWQEFTEIDNVFLCRGSVFREAVKILLNRGIEILGVLRSRHSMICMNVLNLLERILLAVHVKSLLNSLLNSLLAST